MPTIFSHALIAAGMANAIPAPTDRSHHQRFIGAAALLAVLPDADALSFRLGIPYAHPLGHRGLTHSFAFAALGSLVAASVLYRLGDRKVFYRWPRLFLAALSHLILDMLTNGGLGCAIWAPFSWHRDFFAWRPIPVSPIGLRSSLWSVLAWEVTFLWPWGGLLLLVHSRWWKRLVR